MSRPYCRLKVSYPEHHFDSSQVLLASTVPWLPPTLSVQWPNPFHSLTSLGRLLEFESAVVEHYAVGHVAHLAVGGDFGCGDARGVFLTGSGGGMSHLRVLLD